MIASVFIIAVSALLAQWQHYEFLKKNKTELGKSELDDLRSKVEALRVAQGFKR